MLTFVFWLLLLVIAWPIAILALLLYPIVWLIALPFRLIGVSVNALFALLYGLITLPVRIFRGR